ncbi:MAG: putative Serine-type D-Ala-D-Ala carboxypeptidase [Candidatus Saccharibacteria bacterium]|nr:putative Serine-type D-Ala-D-Ala carboxypeptidase [Candidatus Saccharibacteria bacterium]
MRIHTKRGLKGLLKRYLISIVAIVVAIGAAGGFLYWYNDTKNAEMNKMTLDAFTANVKLDKTIADLKAKKAAELKAQQEAAAKAAADQAQTANSSTATTVDSSTCNTSKAHNDPNSIDVVVNKKHCIQPVTYAPGDLTSVIDSKGSSYLLSAKVAPGFKAMSDAATADGQSFYLTSSYRSYSDQVSTYAYWVNTSGKTGADTYSARPGYSEHQTGLAFDVAATVNGTNYVLSEFHKTSQYTWLQAHAADYGFIQRYYVGYESITGYEAEEWHYRYVGVTIAKDMQAKGIKTLEQYWGITGGDYY